MTSAALTLVLAFGSPYDFLVSAVRGGGEGRHFTGSPTERWDCGVCHVPENPDAGVRHGLSVTEASGRDLSTLGYEPGARYELIITTDAPGKSNALVFELTTRAGTRSGRFERSPPTTGTDPYACPLFGDPIVLLEDDHLVHSAACPIDRWHVIWNAPATDEGPVTLYGSVVDSNEDSTLRGDVATELIVGFPSPSTLGTAPTQSCSSTSAGVLVLLSLLLANPALGKAKKKRAAPAQQVQPEPQPDSPPTPDVPLTPPPPPPASVEAAPPPPPEAVSTSEAPPPPALPSVTLEAAVGFGYRSMSLSSVSYAVPFSVAFPFGVVRVAGSFFPLRLARASVLNGLEVHAEYAVGWAPQGLGLGVTQALPSQASAALGYRFTTPFLEVAPRVAFFAHFGGVERNSLFDDLLAQGVGGELVATVKFEHVELSVTPRGGAMLDAGALATQGYGPTTSGFVVGGAASIAWRASKDLSVSLRYHLTFVSMSLGRGGSRDLDPVVARDIVHLATLELGLLR